MILTKQHFADVADRVARDELTPGEAYRLALADGLTVDPSCSVLTGSLLHYEGKEEHKDPIDGLRYGHYDLLTADKHQPPVLMRG